MTVQVYLNGHDWLERAMTEEGIAFQKEENCFTFLGNP